jgi:hypothetical protein
MGQPRELHGIARNFYSPRRTLFFLVSTLTVDSKRDVWNSNDLDLGWFALQYIVQPLRERVSSVPAVQRVISSGL